MFYPKGVQAKGVELIVLDKNHDALPVEIVTQKLRQLLKDYDDNHRRDRRKEGKKRRKLKP